MTENTYERWSQESWDQRYSESEKVWSGNPNQRLVEQVAGLTPGTALDVGAGEGGDAIWLAQQGWDVTALDISEVALAKVAAHAAEAGVADRVTTRHQDLVTGSSPLPGGFDLVSAQFLHPPLDKFTEIHESLAAAVKPGGHLLVVGHHPMDVETGVRSGHGHSELLFTPEKVLAALPAGFTVLVSETPTRESHHDHGPSTVTDTVVLARRD